MNETPTESQEQIAIFEWAEWQSHNTPELKLMFHIGNEGHRGGKQGIIDGARNKRIGLKSGVPDICLPVARNGFHGLYIELKRRRGGVVSEQQNKWISELLAQSYAVCVCKGADEAIAVICGYLGIDNS